MQDEQLKEFVDAVANSIEIQQELLSATDLDAIVEVAKKNGYEISAADLIRHQASESLQLSDEELIAIAGGLSNRAKIGLAAGGTALGGAGWALAGLVLYGLLK